ncbi:TetR/AcrR family transcriptional regulator [Amaricoccus sp.]|uniref:TetR/AcrR family transcriptional regulator n=1 Tax=Amaricoccus sp. TaxID=1872485 RepID=UPI001B4A4BBE|nr:TetR/AcrR family transcriptional regulator [Amaricoccus sp.]MBP7002879.1 TetR/AcrR family transcriptional regulator [Amaricoccus sp.]
MEEAGSDPRALGILDSVKAIFASKGFDGASMQDLARAAGMSAGNFYRYFPSKSAIIEAMVERELDEVRAKFRAILRSPDPLATFRATVAERIACGDVCDAAMWAEIEAAATRRPEFAALLDRVEDEIVRSLVAVFARIGGLSEAAAAARFGAHAGLVLMLVQSVSLRCGARRAPGANDEMVALVERTISFILSEVLLAGRPAEAAAAS